MTIKTVIKHAEPTPEILELFKRTKNRAELIFLPDGKGFEEHLPDAEVIYGGIDEHQFPLAENLKWVQLLSTGTSYMFYPAFLESNVILTSLGSALSSVVAEHGVALLMALVRNLHLQRDLQRDKKWQVMIGCELQGMTVGVLGFGRIGHAIAKRLHAFETKTVGLDCKPQAATAYVESVHTMDELPDVFAKCQAVICTLPRTDATRHVINRETIALLPEGSYVINIGRGGTFDESAVVEALRSGHLAAAALDVTEQEPCPPESPLWDEPNLFLTPHSAAYSQRLQQKKIGWFADNLVRYLNGEPLEGLVDPNQGW